MYIYIYICTYIHIYTHILLYLFIYIRTYKCTHVYICMINYICICMNTLNIYVCLYILAKNAAVVFTFVVRTTARKRTTH